MRLVLGQQVTTRDGITGTLVRVAWAAPEQTEGETADDAAITIDAPAAGSHDRKAGDIASTEPAPQAVLDAHAAAATRIAKLAAEQALDATADTVEPGELYFAGFAAGVFVGMATDEKAAAALPGVDETCPCALDGVLLVTRGKDALPALAVKVEAVADAVALAVAAVDVAAEKPAVKAGGK